MALFEVPGWSVQAAPSPAISKKRKRGASTDDKLHSAETNLDKFVKKFISQTSYAEAFQKKKQKHGNKRESPIGPDSQPPGTVKNSKEGTERNSAKQEKRKKKQEKAKKKNKDPTKAFAHGTSSIDHGVAGLTSLQKGMKDSLEGARFRWINEQLYKSDSVEAVKLMQDSPENFHEYHKGFRHQVHSWPSNPVTHYVEELSALPKGTIIADLGCGDAALVRELAGKKQTVISFDLVSDGMYVVEADICSKIPLPGSEPQGSEKSDGVGQVVDVVVCALSLMSTNWPNCIREAWRILKPGGILKIAEVASRVEDVEQFTSLVNSHGFKLKSKDDRNSHFTLLEFKKVPRAMKSAKEWTGLMSRGDVLKPCEYKRR